MDTIIDGAETATQTLTNNDDIIVTRSGYIAVFAGFGITSTSGGSHQMIINGEVLSTAGAPIFVSNSNSIEIAVGATGIVSAGLNTSAINGTLLDDFELVNAGQITGSNGVRVATSDGNGFGLVINTGGIYAEGTGVIGTVNGAGFEVRNSGEIFGTEGIIAASTTADSLMRIVNTGTITGTERSIESANSTRIIVQNSGDIFGTIEFADGNDVYQGHNGFIDGSIFGDAGNDVMRGGAEDNRFFGGTENDLLYGHLGDDFLQGDAGSDFLVGGSGDDTLLGGGRNDRLVGGRGDDSFVGGGAGDEFVMQFNGNGHDRIVDFQDGSDVIDIAALGVANFAALDASGAIRAANGFLVIDFQEVGASGSLRIDNLALSDLDATDFVF